MTNIFNLVTTTTPTIWSAQSAAISISGGSLTSTEGSVSGGAATLFAAALNVSITFQRQSQTRYPIGGGTPIKMLGIPRGTITIQTLIGPSINIEQFLAKFGDNCQPFDLNINTEANANLKNNCSTDSMHSIYTGTKITCTGCSGQQIQFQLQSQNLMSVATGVFVIEFTGMLWSDGSSPKQA